MAMALDGQWVNTNEWLIPKGALKLPVKGAWLVHDWLWFMKQSHHLGVTYYQIISSFGVH